MKSAVPSVSPEMARRAQGHRGMALGWWKRGRAVQAILGLRKAIETDPTCVDTYIDLARIFLQLRRWNDLADICRAGLRYFLEVGALHKLLITALEERDSWEAACANYGLQSASRGRVAIEDGDILCCLALRNERPRLPYFFEYYRKLGVDRFFVIDNGSTDGSLAWLLEQPDACVWSSQLSFKRANFGSAWFELLLRRYGVGHWCLTVDADEFLYFDGAPQRGLRAYLQNLKARRKRGATGLLLDLYSDRAVRDTVYREGDDPLEHCRYFDRRVYHRYWDGGGPNRDQHVFFGGVRQRVFPVEHDYLLSKSVLLHYLPDVVLESGQHFTNIPVAQLTQEEVCVLHFKFFASFIPYAHEEARREIHAMGAEQYKGYQRVLDTSPDVVLHHPEHSVLFEGAAQLRELGILRAEESPPRVDVPTIAPVAAGAATRPFWSVMLTVYDRVAHLERALASVLVADPGDMQIAVLCDGGDAQRQQTIAQMVRRVAGEHVELELLPQRLGHPAIFNHCIERARGHWVHILHDDDWLEAGFHAVLRRGVEANSAVVAGFCRQRLVHGETAHADIWNSWLERESAGIIDDWFERIARECRVQFSSMVVRRDVYERVGGFLAAAGSAFDWEMWIRVAAQGPVHYEPEALVNVGRDASAESTRLLRSGEQVHDAMTALRLASRHFPVERAATMLQQGVDRIAAYALEAARRFREAGDHEAVFLNVSAAVGLQPSPRTVRRLLEFLRGEDHEFRG